MSELDPENARILSVNAKMIIASKKCRNRTEASERHRIGEDRKEEKKEREKKTEQNVHTKNILLLFLLYNHSCCS